MRRIIASVVALLVSVALSACGGGSTNDVGATPIVTTKAPTPSATPNTAPNVAIAMQIGGTAEKAAQTIEAHEYTARGGKHADYVSGSTLGVKVIVYPHGSGTPLATYVYDVSSGSSICTSGSPRTCTVALTLQPANYDFAMTLYDEAPVSGAIPSGAKALSTGTLSNQTIQPYTTNSLAFIVDGIVASMTPSTTFASVPADGASHTIAVSFIAADADGNPITGSQPYASPITVSLAESGGSSNATLLVNGVNAGSSATITGPGSSVSLQYNGGGSPGYTTVTTISSASASTQQVQVSPLYVSATSVAANDAGQTNNVTVSEVGAPTTSYSTSGWSCSGFSAGVSNIGSGSGTLSVTSPAAVAGSALQSSYSCGNLTLKDAYGTSRSIAVSAAIPTTQVCATVASGVYIGAKVGASYEVGNGTLCSLNVSPASVNIYTAPGNDSLHPATATIAASESNDPTTFTADGSACSSLGLGVSPSFTAGGSLSGTASGNAVAASGSATGTCTMTLKDANGQNQQVAVNVAPSVQTVGVISSAGNGGCIQVGTARNPNPPYQQGPKYECRSWLNMDLGASAYGGSDVFTPSTNSLLINLSITDSSSSFMNLHLVDKTTNASTLLTLSRSGATATYNKTILLPGASGDSYEIALNVYDVYCGYDVWGDGGPCGSPPDITPTINGYVVQQANGTGTTSY